MFVPHSCKFIYLLWRDTSQARYITPDWYENEHGVRVDRQAETHERSRLGGQLVENVISVVEGAQRKGDSAKATLELKKTAPTVVWLHG